MLRGFVEISSGGCADDGSMGVHFSCYDVELSYTAAELSCDASRQAYRHRLSRLAVPPCPRSLALSLTNSDCDDRFRAAVAIETNAVVICRSSDDRGQKYCECWTSKAAAAAICVYVHVYVSLRSLHRPRYMYNPM